MKSVLFSGIIISAVILAGCYKKNDPFNPVSGTIPADVIQIRDSSFYPEIDTIALGARVAFNNITSVTHRIISSDSSTIVTPDIAPGSNYSFTPGVTGEIYFHCVQHPTVQGVLYIRP